jgi:hypothetical protein
MAETKNFYEESRDFFRQAGNRDSDQGGALGFSGDFDHGHNHHHDHDPHHHHHICFMAQTRIRTPVEEVAVEGLKIGDLVQTNDGRSVPVHWIGRQTVSGLFISELQRPIRIKAGALGDNVPCRDLLVSPDHALLIDDVLVQAGALVNGTSIQREKNPPAIFIYYHVELDDHSLIFADGTPAETFIENADRANFDNWAEFEALYPNGKIAAEMSHPRAKASRQIPRSIRERLAKRDVALYRGQVASAA